MHTIEYIVLVQTLLGSAVGDPNPAELTDATKAIHIADDVSGTLDARGVSDEALIAWMRQESNAFDAQPRSLACDEAAAKVELLQRKAEIERKSRAAELKRKGETVPNKSAPLQDCQRKDARLLSSEDLYSIQVPTVLEHAWEVLDNSTWARTDFERGGPFENVPVPGSNLFYNPSTNLLLPDEIVNKTYPMWQAIDYDQESIIFLCPMCVLYRNSYSDFGGLDQIYASLQERNGGVPGVGPISALLQEMDSRFHVSLSSRGQWSQMHTHAESLFMQVTGRKGWIFGDALAWQDEAIRTINGGSRITTDFLSHSDVCGYFTRGIVPQSITYKSSSFMACELNPGEALFWPGLCEGNCGFWHTTCGLTDWDAGLAYLGFKNATTNNYMK